MMTSHASAVSAHKSLITIGSESQSQEHQLAVTGIQRVVCEAHKGLADLLGIAGVEIGWVHTSNSQRSLNFKTEPYLATDPVLNGPEVQLSEIDGLVILDIPMQMDFPAVLVQKAIRDLQVFVLIHDILPLINPQWFPKAAPRSFKLYIQQVLHAADHIIVPSEQVKRDLLNLGWKHRAAITVIPLGSIHKQRTPLEFPDSQVSAMYVSTIAPRKGHDKLLDAFDVLRARGCDIDLTLIGSIGWECEDLVNRIRYHPDLNGRLRWYRNADDHVVEMTASKCNIGVIPSEGEGFGMFLEEALTLGLKVVGSDIPVFREREQPNVYFANLDGESLADSLVIAAGRPWEPMVGGQVRSMTDFSRDLTDLITERLMM